MLPRRRIFRSAASPRAWRGPLLALGLAAGAAVLVGVGGSGSLLGRSPAAPEWASPAAAVRVVDGETLRLDDRVVRLAGVGAPPRGEACRDGAGRSLDCGAGAAEALSRLLAGRDVMCRITGHDRAGRALGRCVALSVTGPVDVNAALVSAGWALASGSDLAAQQGGARSAGAGYWSALATPPAGWREAR